MLFLILSLDGSVLYYKFLFSKIPQKKSEKRNNMVATTRTGKDRIKVLNIFIYVVVSSQASVNKIITAQWRPPLYFELHIVDGCWNTGS